MMYITGFLIIILLYSPIVLEWIAFVYYYRP